MGTSLINIDRTNGHLARDSHQHAIELLGGYHTRDDVDVPWTSGRSRRRSPPRRKSPPSGEFV
jgi:hypothetical protein